MSAIILVLSVLWPMSAPHKLLRDQTVTKDACSLAQALTLNYWERKKTKENKFAAVAAAKFEIRKELAKWAVKVYFDCFTRQKRRRTFMTPWQIFLERSCMTRHFWHFLSSIAEDFEASMGFIGPQGAFQVLWIQGNAPFRPWHISK